jgi:hypothetical protein
MRKLYLLLIFVAGVAAIGTGFRYMLTSEFMPYHSEAVGKDWSALEPGVQAIVLGLLRIVGGAFIAFGITALWMLVPLKAGVRYSRLALLTITISLWGPTLYVTLAVRAFAPNAQTPVLPTLVMITLIGAGLLLSLREGQLSKGPGHSRNRV